MIGWIKQDALEPRGQPWYSEDGPQDLAYLVMKREVADCLRKYSTGIWHLKFLGLTYGMMGMNKETMSD